MAADDPPAVLAGISPDGEILTASRVAEAKRVTGFDLTWSAPKSVSLLYGLSDPVISGTARAVHEEAVTQALGYLERHAFMVRRGVGGERRIDSRGMVAAAFVHRTSRAGDPQLHTHVLVANVAEGIDGVWSAPTAASSTTTPAPPASSIKSHSGPGWARTSASASGRSAAAWPKSDASVHR